MAAALTERDETPAVGLTCTALLTARDRRNMNRVNLACLAWAIVFLGASYALRYGLVAGPLAWAVALVACAASLGIVVTYVHFLRHADELLQRIQLEGLAWAFGAGFVVTTGWRLLERAGAPRLDIDDSLLPMIVAWVVGQTLARRRYS